MNKSPGMIPDLSLDTGEIGCIVTNLKITREARVGDTVTLKKYMAKGVRWRCSKVVSIFRMLVASYG